MDSDAAKAIGIIIVAIILFILNPFLAIWAWNVLFGAALTIPLNFGTWLATAILLNTIKPVRAASK